MNGVKNKKKNWLRHHLRFLTIVLLRPQLDGAIGLRFPDDATIAEGEVFGGVVDPFGAGEVRSSYLANRTEAD
jgi:hypothetical protein